MVEPVQRWPATSSSRTFSEPISISSARSFRITALAIASRPTAIAPTAVTARASGPIADGPRMRAPTAIAPVTLAIVAVEPTFWRRMLMMLDMVPPPAVRRAQHATIARVRTRTQGVSGMPTRYARPAAGAGLQSAGGADPALVPQRPRLAPLAADNRINRANADDIAARVIPACDTALG